MKLLDQKTTGAVLMLIKKEQLKSKEKGMKGKEKRMGGGVQRQKIQEDKNSFSKSREQRVLSEKVHASVKTRLKGNRRLSAGQSGCPRAERETSGGGGHLSRTRTNKPWTPTDGWPVVPGGGRRVRQHL